MVAILSTTTMITKLSGLLGTDDLNEWKQGFVQSLVDRVEAGEVTRLTEKQLGTLERLHGKHFA